MSDPARNPNPFPGPPVASPAEGRVPLPAPGSALGLPPVWVLGATGVAVLLLAFSFAGTFRTLWSSWMNNDNYSHGILVLPISLILTWMARRRLAEAGPSSSWFGVPVLLLGVLLQIAGLRGDVTIFQGWGFVVTVAGLVWTWCGGRVTYRLAFPLAFLFFMVPALPIFMNVVSFRLKEVAASGSVQLAQFLGAPVVQRGMDLYFPSGTLTVENACSGMNSLIALMALGALFGYVGHGPVWRRALLFALSVPIAIAANVVRITSLCVVASVSNTEEASGLFHDIGGFLLFGVALVLLGLTKRLLRC